MNILFLCVGNSARSQIAEGLAKDMLPKHFNIKSAGSRPSSIVHKDAIMVMKEIGIDISKNKTKSIESIDKDFMTSLDYIILLCADEICPVVTNSSKLLRWPNEDPDNNSFSDIQSKNAFIKTRDDIFKLLKLFIIKELK